MSGYSVDLELVEELVVQMAAFERHLESVVGEVEGRWRRVQSSWTGVAAAESLEAQQRWHTGAQDMHEALGVLRSIATTARANYASAITANTRMWAM